jgi:protein-tyrosine-phosphatase/DNA-binding transcriptional ArsR family regulator
MRAQQISALTDPVALRLLSAIAASPDRGHPAPRLADALALPEAEIERAVNELREAGLVALDTEGRNQLTADAWVRFGRLLASGVWEAESRVEPTSTPAEKELPRVVQRIVDDLTYRFSSTFSPETVARYVAESYVLLAERAHITRFLPSLTAKFATDRLSALATAKGLILRGTPEVLFVCVQNAGRSQMAAAILRHLAGDAVHVRTAGSAPAATVHPVVIEALDEIGVPLATEFPKPLTEEVVQAADYVITMGCGDACPVYPGRRYMDWALEDPVDKSLDEVRVMRDRITDLVRTLLAEMTPAVQPAIR